MLYFEIANRYLSLGNSVKDEIIREFISVVKLSLKEYDSFCKNRVEFRAEHSGFYRYKIESGCGVFRVSADEKALAYMLVLALKSSSVVLVDKESSVVRKFNKIVAKHVGDLEPLVYVSDSCEYSKFDFFNYNATVSVVKVENFEEYLKEIFSAIDLFGVVILEYSDFVVHHEYIKSYLEVLDYKFRACPVASTMVEGGSEGFMLKVVSSEFEMYNYIYQKSSRDLDVIFSDSVEAKSDFIKKIYSKNVAINRVNFNRYDLYNSFISSDKNIIF